MPRYATNIFLTALCWLALAVGLHAADFRELLPEDVKPPNRFGFAGDASFLGAGAAQQPVEPRKWTVEVSAPGRLDAPHTEYRLVRDIVADHTAFEIVADHITLNLNGHTVTYNRKPTPDEAYGVMLTDKWNITDVKVLNGRIIQGAANSPGALSPKGEKKRPHGSGVWASFANPVFGRSLKDCEFAGLYLEYSGDNLAGMHLSGSGLHIHHNEIYDKGRGMTDRHRGLGAIYGAHKGWRVHHNLIRRSRHNGIRIQAGLHSEVYANVINIDGVGTNATGIAAGGKIYENRIVGRGEHPIGIYLHRSVLGDRDPVECWGNWVDVQNTRASAEYGSTGAAGLRMQHKGEADVHHNFFLVRAKEGALEGGLDSWGRGLFVSQPDADTAPRFHDNLIIAVNWGGRAKAAGIAVVAGNRNPNLVFADNVVASSWGNVLLADSYGHADGYARFTGNRFIRLGDSPAYRTVRSQYSALPSTGVFISNTLENGASWDNLGMEFDGKGLKDLQVGWRLAVEVREAGGSALKGAEVEVRDVDGNGVAFGETDAQGRFSCEVVQFELTNRKGKLGGKSTPLKDGGRRVVFTPHAVVLRQGGRTVEQRVEMDRDRSVSIIFE